MALVKASLSLGSTDRSNDITNNLATLQFENGLTNEELSLNYLRKQSYALTVTACAQAAFFVSRLRDARLISNQLKDSVRVELRNTKVLQPDQFHVGVIGCGRLGSQLVRTLLSFGEVEPDELHISTRRPETLSDLEKRGVHCGQNNAEVAAAANIIFLTCLPSQLSLVAEELKDHLSKNALIWSFVTAVSAERLRSLLGTSNIICPLLTMTRPHDTVRGNTVWDLTAEVTTALENPQVVEATCPLKEESADSVVEPNDQFALGLIYSVSNYCHHLQMTSSQTIASLNSLFLGHTLHRVSENVFQPEDFGFTSDSAMDKESFCPFDFVSITKTSTRLRQKLKLSSYRKSFLENYCSVFHEHIERSRKSLAVIKKSIQIVLD